MTYSQRRRRKILKIAKKRQEGRTIQPGEYKSVERFIEQREMRNG